MAFDEYQAERIKRIFEDRNAVFNAKRMMGGLCFMVDDKMCVGTHIDKRSQKSLLMARIGDIAYEEALKKEGCQPMDFTGRPMKGYVFVEENGVDMEEDLEYYIDLALAFNPLAKSSKKKS